MLIFRVGIVMGESDTVDIVAIVGGGVAGSNTSILTQESALTHMAAAGRCVELRSMSDMNRHSRPAVDYKTPIDANGMDPAAVCVEIYISGGAQQTVSGERSPRFVGAADRDRRVQGITDIRIER